MDEGRKDTGALRFFGRDLAAGARHLAANNARHLAPGARHWRRFKTALDDLASRKQVVQAAVNANPAWAKTIATSAWMNIKASTSYRKPTLKVALTSPPGQVLARAKATRRAVYEWQTSADRGKTWVSVGVTNEASITIPGLVLGTTYTFRFRTTVKRITADFCQPYSLLVH